MDEVNHGAALYPRQLSELFGGVMSADEIRALTRKARRPLPCIRCGSKRPVTKVYPEVFGAYLAYEMGAVGYAEVEQTAGRCVMGARS